jgi:glucose-6-phosphate 1-dehydrogenase
VLDPIIGDKTPVYKYKPGTWGPKEADALIAQAGGWNDPKVEPAHKDDE